MCSVFEILNNNAAIPDQLAERGVRFCGAVMEKRMVRRTDLATVVTADFAVEEMRWGFQRSGLGVVNNSRDDKLNSPMWRESFSTSRCLIPMSGFYEWSGAAGRKQAHRFSHPGKVCLWAAGIWEESKKHGRCFSMLTTSANVLMSTIHERMPAILSVDTLVPYLAGEVKRFAVAEELLVERESASPLAKKKVDEAQGELF